jgi:3-oxo-5alpha-steroid 4-dehydrogenase
MIRYLVASSGPGADEERIRIYCEASLDHYAWLVEQGLEFKRAFWPEHHDSPGDEGLRWAASETTHPFKELARPAPRSHKLRHPGLAGGALMRLLIARVAELGAEIRTGTRCEALVTDDRDGVVGIVSSAKGAEERVLARRGVVLATGGFIFNPAMLALYAPQLVGCSPIGAPTDDGSGIRMGIGLGAAAIQMDAGFVGLALHPPEEIIVGILVDPRGQRFVNEDAYLGRVGQYARLRADGDVYLILDATVASSPVLGENELVATADSIEELEAELGLAGLVHTVGFYNEHARNGRDPLFGKQPAFLRPLHEPPLRAYRYKVGESFYPAFTLGGLWTRPTGEVRRPDGSVISGLYAAGRVASGVPARAYNTGTSIGDATYFGRRAGRSAAAHRTPTPRSTQ